MRKEYPMRKKRSTRRRYPKNWKVLATVCKARADWRCEECQEEHFTQKVSKRTGLVYHMRLHAAHVGHYTQTPKLKALCPSCHARMDIARRRREARVKLERLKHRSLLVRYTLTSTYA